MRKFSIISIVGMVLLSSGCSWSRYYDGKTPIELEQYENPMIWKEVIKIQATLWPLEKNVNNIEKNLNEMRKKVNELEKTVNELEKNLNEMRNEVATTKLSSIQANKNIELLHAEIQQIKGELIKKEEASTGLPILPKKKMVKSGTAAATEESKKPGPDIPAIIINDIRYHKVSDTQDQVRIYVSAQNDPKRQTLRGESPRIVLDFLNSRTIDKEKFEINTDGNFMKRIRIRSYKEPMQKVRVVFDMIPTKNYSIEQKFTKNENMYTFDIKAD